MTAVKNENENQNQNQNTNGWNMIFSNQKQNEETEIYIANKTSK